MKTKPFRNVNYVGWIVIIVVFLFIYFSYFFIYIPSNEALLEQKAFRILKEYGKNMIDKNRYYENHFKNYGLFYKIKHLKNNSNEIATIINKDTTNKTLINDLDSVIKYLLPYVKTDSSDPYTQKIFSDFENTFYLSYKNGEIEQKKIDTTLKKISFQDSLGNSVDILLKKPFVNRIPINNFMENLKFDELFDKITIFNNTAVFYDSKSEKIFDITNPEALKDTLDKSQGGIHKIMNISGQKTHILILPINFRGEDFFIAGFIPDLYFRQKTRQINTQLIIYIAGFLLLAFIGMPVLKIIFIDPRERLKAFDATASGISFMAGLGILTIITISLLKTQVADPVVNRNRINSVSTNLFYNIKTDIDSIKNLGNLIGKKSSINDSIKAKKTENIDSTTLSYRVVNHFLNGTTNFWQVPSDYLKYPFQLNEIFLTDVEGIVQKTYSRTPFSELVQFKLDEREYFKNINEINKSWPETGLNLYIESIKSYNTGNFETAISFHTDSYNDLQVLAITSKIPSLYNQVLPSDMDFIIINNKGNVLYHSKTDKNLHENFIHECDSDPELLNAINLRTKKNFYINYDEKKWLARIQPFDNTPLFHITLLDLSKGRNINASIFLFTFFFSLVSFVFLSIAFLVLSIFVLSIDNTPKHEWILKWIILKPQKFNTYITLIVILAILAIMQIIGYWVTDSPEQNFVYQLILSFSVLLISILMLNDNWSDLPALLKKPGKYLPVTILILILATLIFFVLNKHELIFRKLLIAAAPLSVFVVYFILSFKFSSELKPKELLIERIMKLEEKKYISNTYLAFLMFWLVSISVIPVVEYYLSFKKQETEHRIEDIKLGVALENIDLNSEFKNYKFDSRSNWFHRIRGNQIDGLEISELKLNDQLFKSALKKHQENSKLKSENTELHDLVFSILNFQDTFKTKNYSNYWFSNNKVYFKQGTTAGIVYVSYPRKNLSISSFWYVLVVILTAGIVFTLIWYLLRYISFVILNLKQEKMFTSELSWIELIKTKKHKKILLYSYDGYSFLEKTKRIQDVDDIQALQLISTSYDLKNSLNDSSDIIWIKEFEQVIYTPDSHENLISNIKALNENSDKIVVLDIPFEIEHINAFFEEYVDSGNLKPKDLKNIFLLKKKWTGLFEGFFHYNGYLKQKGTKISTISRVEDAYINFGQLSQENHFNKIWSNISSYEKIVLHDLADDGLVNRKDNSIIEKLVQKRLIIPNPAPEIFSDEFRKFILEKMNLNDIKLIESKLGLKGRWHNARYIILLIITPLTAFILISQGLSLEKIFGIFAAGIAAVTGLMRLFDSSIFSQN